MAERRKRPSNRDALIVFALAFGPPKLPTAHSSLGGRLIPRQSIGGHDEPPYRSVTSTHVLHYDG